MKCKKTDLEVTDFQISNMMMQVCLFWEMFTLANIKLECVVEFLSQQFDDLAQTKNELEVYCIKIYQAQTSIVKLDQTQIDVFDC